jgi:Putative beta-barrel porin-2, OmpL-like. bbp2
MRHPLRSRLLPALCAGTFLGLSGGYASAAEPAPPPPPPDWWSTVTATGVIDAGVTFNPELPGDGLNFGQLYTDKANQPLLNGVLLTLQRPFDPKATDYDFTFKFQFQYGSDARYNHYLGEFNYIIDDRNQFTPIEAWLGYHLPWLFSGGIDVKAGQWVTLEGAETIDPTTNYTYSKSYIFNFGIPFVETGVLAIAHVDPLLDIYVGITGGENTTFGYRGGDNNGGPAGIGAIGLNLLDGNLTILASTHIGPELPDTFGFPGTNTINTAGTCFCNPNTALRYLNDITATWKINDAISLITDLNYIRDDGFKTSGYGVAQYAIWSVLDWLKIVGRVEVWRDNGVSADNGITHTGFFVAGFPGNFDFVNSEYGFLNTSFVGVPTTYFETTVSLNITPPVPDGWSFIKGITLRPEVRYDTSLNGTTPFDGSGFGGRGFPGIPEFGLPAFGTGTKSYQVTFGGDVVIKF